MHLRNSAQIFSTILVASIGWQTDLVMAKEVEIKSTTCRKPANGKGCTANGQTCFSAPQGEFFDVGSFGPGTVKSFWAKGPKCGTAKGSAFTYITPPGFPAAVALPIQFCASTQIQSGSGFSNIGKVAFVNCSYNYRTHKIPIKK